MKKVLSFILTLALLFTFTVSALASTNDKQLETAKNPGLGVRNLHKQGITGKGVNIAYVGMGILDGDVKKFTHTEFRRDLFTGYKDMGWYSKERFFGPERISSYKTTFDQVYTTISALAGKNVGTAPDVNIYMVGVVPESLPAITAGINHVVERNKSLAKTDQVRIILVESFTTGNKETRKAYQTAIENAEKANIIVVRKPILHWHDGIDEIVYGDGVAYNTNSPDDVSKAVTGSAEWKKDIPETLKITIWAPDLGRTLAVNDNSYTYFAPNGRKRSMTECSFMAGVVAMGLQVNPDLTVAQIKKLLMETKDKNNHMVNLPKFIEAVKKTV